MLKRLAAASLTLVGVAGSVTADTPEPTIASPEAVSRRALARQFLHPSPEYGPIDTWWWEAGRADRDKFRWQLQEFKDKGISGTLFYPRWVYGEAESLTSDPPYWSEEWWDFTRFATEEHKRLGLTSSFANWTLTQFQQNLVRKEKQSNPALEGRVLAIHRRESPGALQLGPEEKLLDAAAYRKEGAGIDYSSRRVLTESVRDGKLDWKTPDVGWLVTAITSKPWDLNYLDRRVGQRFAAAFLGEYEKRLPEFIGNTLQAFGADEMILLNGEFLYSDSLIDKVRAERGYDVTPYLIGLFYDIGVKTDQVRADYYGAMSAMLEENFYRPIMTWLESRGMKHTAVSQLGSGDPLLQTAQLGDFFRYLRTFHVPGNEDPFRSKPGERRLVASKISSSVAHLYRRSRVGMCVYYSSGWGHTQEENLAWTNENYAKGLNLHTRCSVQANLMGGWYEWVPPQDHFFQPHWRYWKSFADYTSRLSALLSQGEHRADVALFYPITTIHANWVAGRNPGQWSVQQVIHPPKDPFDPAAVDASESLQDLAKAIYHDGIDFNFTDNDSLERATINGRVLEVAGVEFRSIVLPALSTIRLASMRKVREFYEAGGTVVSFGRVPTASAENGRGDPQLRAMVEAIFGTMPDSSSGIVGRRNARGGQAYFVARDVEQVPPILSRAIVRDVAAPEKDLFHLHKKIGEVDVYFLFNVKPVSRELPVRFRTQGQVEIWNAFTGETRRAYHWKRLGEDLTEVKLKMEPNEGVIVVFSPGEAGPAVLEGDLARLEGIEAEKDKLSLRGFDDIGGRKKVRVLYSGHEYVAETQIAPPPQTIRLQETFAFRLEPTMDNRWGDFRYPASNTVIGAEARRFRYAEEDEMAGTERGWQQADFDDALWPEVTCSYGPYWWHLGGFTPGAEPNELLEQARRDEVDVKRSWNRGVSQLAWQPHIFSKKFGHFSLTDSYTNNQLAGLLGVPENFLVLGPPAPGGDTHYWFTHIYVPTAGDYVLQVGVSPEKYFFSLPFRLPPVEPPSGARTWVNGEEKLLKFERESPDRRGQVSRTQAHLRQGWNTVLLEVARAQEGPSSLYAALYQSEPQELRYVPLLRWFREPQSLVYDITPQKVKRVGWYRFKAPPGVREIRLQTQARAVQAWVDGQSVPVRAGKISLSTAQPGVSQIALRVEQEPGSYAGAAFAEPVGFSTEAGQISLGDWSQHGLASYSGIGIYSQKFRLARPHLAGKVILDLGQAQNVAEVFVNGKSAGVGLARPFRFDVTQLVKAGPNRLEIRVANTLANHMSTYPTKWVLEGQTISGLLGPVELQFHAPAKLVAYKVP